MENLIQIAGIRNLAEADMLIAAGAGALGFPLRLNIHAPDLSEEAAAEIVRQIRKRVCCILITYLSRASRIVELADFLGVDMVQIHGPIAIAELQKIRVEKPGLRLIKSLVVAPDNLNVLEQQIQLLSSRVDYFITDTFDPVSGASGATGKTHDWAISRHLVEVSSRPVILAGGLTPENVSDAIRAVRPAGVDVHTGIENSDGGKDLLLARQFIQNARDAFDRFKN